VWVNVLPGVYRAASTPESWHQKLVAACLWAGEGAVVSHLSAARLHGLEGIPPMRRREPIELTIQFGTYRRSPGLLVHRSRKLERGDRSTVDGIPVTGLARTLVDLSPMLDERRLCVALDSGLARHRSIDVRMLRRDVRRLKTKGRRAARGLERLLAERAPEAVHLDSALERRFSAALRSAGLPRPAEHFDVVEGGRHIAELDFAYPRVRLGIELDGANVHRRPSVWERDLDQRSDLAAAGWRLVLVTWAQLETDEKRVLERVARALAGTRA
jgi:hypothetical protein